MTILIGPWDRRPQPLDPAMQAVITERSERWLKVVSPIECPNGGQHNASVLLDRCEVDLTDPTTHISGSQFHSRHPAWPQRCQECGYCFGRWDTRLLLCLPLMRLSDGTETPAVGAPDGTWWVDVDGDTVTIADGRLCVYAVAGQENN